MKICRIKYESPLLFASSKCIEDRLQKRGTPRTIERHDRSKQCWQLPRSENREGSRHQADLQRQTKKKQKQLANRVILLFGILQPCHACLPDRDLAIRGKNRPRLNAPVPLANEIKNLIIRRLEDLDATGKIHFPIDPFCCLKTRGHLEGCLARAGLDPKYTYRPGNAFKNNFTLIPLLFPKTPFSFQRLLPRLLKSSASSRPIYPPCVPVPQIHLCAANSTPTTHFFHHVLHQWIQEKRAGNLLGYRQ